MNKPESYITRDMFGDRVPLNWEAIADWMNWKIHWSIELFGADRSKTIRFQMSRFFNGDLSNTTCPVPVYPETTEQKPVRFRYTCSDTIQSMVRDTVELELLSPDDAYTLETWQRVKKRFARRHSTRLDFVNITGAEQLPAR